MAEDKPSAKELIMSSAKKHRDIEGLVEMVEHYGMEAHLEAEKTLIEGKKKHRDKLDDPEFASKTYSKTMADHLDKKAREHWGVTGDAYSEHLLSGFYGITEETIREGVTQAGSNYTKQVHDATMKKVQEQLEGRLLPTAYSDLTQEHAADIIKHVKGHEKPHFIKADQVRRNEAVQLLIGYHRNDGSITEDMVSKVIPVAAIDTDKKKEMKKEMYDAAA